MTNLLIGPAHPLRGGIADFNEALCRAFNRHGTASSVVSFYLQYPGVLFPGKTQYSSDPAPAGIVIRPLISSVNPFSWSCAARFVNEARPDYVVIRYWLPFLGPCLGRIARLVKRNGKTKVIALADNIVPHEKRPGDRAFTSYFLKGCDGYVTLSKQVLDELHRFLPNARAAWHPHPVYDIFGVKAGRREALQRLGLPECRYLLFFGFIRKYKGLDLLLEAMADERVRNSGTKLIIAGEFYEDPAPYRDIIRRHNLEDHIILHDRYIPREEVRYYFAAADLVVQPYRAASQSGITQVAGNFDRPMLVTRTGGLDEVVSHMKSGYVTDISPDAVAEAITDFYRNNRMAQFVAGVQEEKKRFEWRSLVECIEKVYGEL